MMMMMMPRTRVGRWHVSCLTERTRGDKRGHEGIVGQLQLWSLSSRILSTVFIALEHPQSRTVDFEVFEILVAEIIYDETWTMVEFVWWLVMVFLRWWDNLTPRTIWHLGQFDTDHARRTIWHRGQFDTEDNLTPSCKIGQFDTDHARRTIWHRGQFDTEDNLTPS